MGCCRGFRNKVGSRGVRGGSGGGRGALKQGFSPRGHFVREDPLSEASWSLRGIPGPYPLDAPKVPTPPSTSLHCRCRGLGGEGSALHPQQSLSSGARDVKS